MSSGQDSDKVMREEREDEDKIRKEERENLVRLLEKVIGYRSKRRKIFISMRSFCLHT